MEASKRAIIPVSIGIALLVALALAFSAPQEAFAMKSPWGAGTTYNAKTKTLTVKSGKRTIKSLSKKYKSKRYYVDRLVIKGGTTKLNTQYGYLKSLTVKKGKLSSAKSISVSGNMRVTGGTVTVTSRERYGRALNVMGDLTVSGGAIVSKSTKEGCTALDIYGDAVLRKGSITVSTKGKSADGINVSGYLSVHGGKIKSTTTGKYGTAMRVHGDFLMSNGTVSAISSRDQAIYCSDLLKITGGKVTAKSVQGEMAMESGEQAVVNPLCLASIRGGLPEGAQFATGGVTYQVVNRYGFEAAVVKGSTSAPSVTYGGVTYTLGLKLAAGSAA